MVVKTIPRVVASLMLAAIAGSASADTLLLRSGDRLDGTFLGASGDIVYLRVEGEIRQVAVDDVASISFDKDRETPRGLNPGDQSTGRAVIVGAGAMIIVAFSERLLTGNLREGQVFRSELAPAGSDVYGKIVQHEPGAAGMMLTQMMVAGERVPIKTKPRPLPQAGENLEQVEFRVDRPFTLRVAGTR